MHRAAHDRDDPPRRRAASRRRRPPGLLIALAMPAWAGFLLGVVELSAAQAQLPSGAPVGLLAGCCAAFGMLLGLAVSVPVRTLRAGIAALFAPRTRPGTAGLRWPPVWLGGALFLGGCYALSRWLQDAGLQARSLGAWLAVAVLALVALSSVGVASAVQQWLARRGRRPLVHIALGAIALGAWATLAYRFVGDVGPAWAALPHRLLAVTGLLFGGALLFTYADRWLWGPAQWPLTILALLVPTVGVPWAATGLSAAPTTTPVLIGHTQLVGAVPRVLRSLSDRDGDGYASLLGGGDCDDGDERIHPGAIEVLGNDLDEDCDGLVLRGDPTEGTLSGRLGGPSCQSDFALPADVNVVLLVADAARADRLSAAHPRDAMPELRALTSEATWFERCYTPHPSTAYALPALFTGLQSRWARDLMASQYADIPENRSLLQTELLKRGYRAAGIYGHFLAGHRHGMTRGMQQTRLRREAVSSSRVADDAIELIDAAHQASEPLFLYAHFNDPHWEYASYGPEIAPWGNEQHVERYDGELRNVDLAIGRIVAALRDRDLFDRTLLIVTADHGQEFGEHGGRFHGQTMYEEVIRVPCIIRAPGLEPRRVDQPVSLVDIYPTLIDLLELEARPPTHGVSLEPLMGGMRCTRGPVIGEMQPWTQRPPFKPWLWYLVSGHDKIIYDVKNHTYQVFDLAADPAERLNLVEADPPRFERLRSQLHAEVVARIALPKDSSASQRLEFGPLPAGTPRH